MTNQPPIPTEPGIYWAKHKTSSEWIFATLVEHEMGKTPGQKLLVLPDNEDFDVREYVGNRIKEGWKFVKAEPPKE